MTMERRLYDAMSLSRESRLRFFVQGDARHEAGAVVHPAGDRQLPAMAGEDVLHDGEAKTRAVLGAALGRVDAVKSLGQSRKMFRRNAVPVVPHGQGRFLLRRRDRDLD